jgi:hypothetical protein
MKVIFFFLFCLNAYSATQPHGCGSYDIYGRLEKSKEPGEFQYVVHGGTVSQYKFNLTADQEIKLVPYLERSSKIRATISQPMNDFNGDFSSIEKVEDVVPDPAKLTRSHGFFLVKNGKCK